MSGNEDTCISDDLLWRYIEENTDSRETRMVRHHIIRCSTCFSIVASVLYDEKHPFTADEMAEVDKLLSGDREKLIDGLLQKHKNTAKIVAKESQEKNALRKTNHASFWRAFIHWANHTPFARPAFGIAFLLLVAITTWQSVNFFADSQNNADQYVYDDRAPFLPSSLRRSSAAAAELSNWRQRLYHAIRNQYTMQDYENAISTFEAIEPVILSLPADSMTNQVISRLRDIHFYKGLSHFALSRSRVRTLTEMERALQTQKAIQSLTVADSLVKTHKLSNGDREAFYLGLVLGLKGEKIKALEKLKLIPRESRFYEESLRLKKNWSER